MKTNYFLPALLALSAVLNLSGCIVAHDDYDHGYRASRSDGYRYYDGYRYEHGDRVSRDGRRDVGWCDIHRDDIHCRVATAP